MSPLPSGCFKLWFKWDGCIAYHLYACSTLDCARHIHVRCGGLNKNGPHRLIYLNVESPGNGCI